MSKQIIIIGGGISGLALLHNLKKKFVGRSDVQVHLLEQNTYAGGTIRTKYQNKCYFEYGPEGFLNNKESALKLAQDLGLEDELVGANPTAKKRYISIKNELHQVPMSPSELLSFKPLSLLDKVRIPLEMLIRKGKDPKETVYEFGVRRFGENITNYFLDPIVKGIYGGDAKKLNLRLAFPKIYELEQEYGSLLKGLILTMLKNSKGKKKGEASGSPMGKLLSFRQGMGQLCEALVKQYEDCIHLDEVVESVDRVGEGFSIVTQKMKYFADELFVCSPAHSASAFLKTLDPVLSELLGKIQYAPMAVVGLVYPKAALGHIPQGFGYLIPSSEKSEVQGVLFPGNVFPGRTADDLFMFRVMIGGSSYPDIMKRTKDELVETAEYELKKRFAINGRTVTEFLALWPNAIPQYDQEYAYLKDGIVYEVSKFPNFHLVANYLGGVSINDCTSNAQAAAEKSALA